jgi:hypothetical protein
MQPKQFEKYICLPFSFNKQKALFESKKMFLMRKEIQTNCWWRTLPFTPFYAMSGMLKLISPHKDQTVLFFSHACNSDDVYWPGNKISGATAQCVLLPLGCHGRQT